MKVRVTILANASRRTKNRVRENGPIFEEIDRKVIQAFQGRGRAVLVVSTNAKWLGWLPLDEVIVERAE